MKPTVDIVLDLMRETFGSEFKTYYSGDPEVIPTFNLPAIIVTQLSDDTNQGAFGQDDVSDEIRVKVVLNKADDYTGSKIDPLNLTDKKIRDYVGSIAADGTYRANTVKGAIRNRIEDEVLAIAPRMRVDFGINPRNTLGETSNVEWTAEGHVTFSVQRVVETNV